MTSTALHILYTDAVQNWCSTWYSLFSDQKNGGFHERLSLPDTATLNADKRLLTQSRQIFTYALALQNGADKSDFPDLDEKFAFLVKHFHTGVGGWCFSVSPTGQIKDAHYDLYGHAFVILAMAHYYKVTQSDEALKAMNQTLKFIERHFAEPQYGGFHEKLNARGDVKNVIRRQNPHMHLLEACLSAYEYTDNEDFILLADKLVGLFYSHFCHGEKYTIYEFFNNDLSPHATEGHQTETGHYFEWVWLLNKYNQLSGKADKAKNNKTIKQLYRFVLKHGFDDTHNGIFNMIDTNGSPVESNKRIWHVFEGLKAAAIMKDAETQSKLLDLIKIYIKPGGKLWAETLSEDLQTPLLDYMPGTTPYHILYGIVEAKKLS